MRYNFGKQAWREENQSSWRSPQVEVDNTRVYIGFRDGGDLNKADKTVFLTFYNPLYTATIAQEDFELKRSRTSLLQRMKELGLRTLRYTNGQQEWHFDVSQ